MCIKKFKENQNTQFVIMRKCQKIHKETYYKNYIVKYNYTVAYETRLCYNANVMDKVQYIDSSQNTQTILSII